jgi:outer membrane protein OmpA-like peptidoglycan-associated protein
MPLAHLVAAGGIIERVVRGVIIGLVLTIGCASAQQPSMTDPYTFEDEGILNTPDDSCHLLQECCDLDEFSDTDGCPTEPEIEFAQGSSALSDSAERGQAEMAAEIRELGGHLRRLRLAGYASDSEEPELAVARALAVRDSLIEHGVSPDILETTGEQHGERGYVAFVVLDCDPIVSN